MTNRLAVYVATYNLKTQLERSLISLSAPYQGCHLGHISVTIVDNGSIFQEINIPASDEWHYLWRRYAHNGLPIHHCLNQAINADFSDYIAVLIDGARLCSPGMVEQALICLSQHQDAVIYTPSYQLGPDQQMYSIAQGYDEEAESTLLLSIGWPKVTTASLIQISTQEPHGGSSWPFFESNALFMHRKTWQHANGFDQQFLRTDGGFVSADLLQRLITLGHELIVLKDHGTFHQLHHGSTTSSALQTRQLVKEMTLEYKTIRGSSPKRYRGPYTCVDANNQWKKIIPTH